MLQPGYLEAMLSITHYTPALTRENELHTGSSAFIRQA